MATERPSPFDRRPLMGHPVPPETYFVLVKISDQLDYLIQLLEQRLP